MNSRLSYYAHAKTALRKIYGVSGNTVKLIQDTRMVAQGENSELRRLLYSTTNGQHYSLVLKREPQSSPEARHVAAIQRWYEREVFFYDHIAPSLNLLTPKSGMTHFDASTNTFFLLLEDLKSPSNIPVTNQHEAALRAAARLHATPIPKSTGPLPVTPVHLELGSMVEDYLKSSWNTVRTSYSGIDTKTSHLIDLLCQDQVYTQLLHKLAEPPLSLIHGDFRPANLVYNTSLKKIIVFDWQFVSLASAAYDFAYYLGLGLTTEERRAKEAMLKQVYIEERNQAQDPNFYQIAQQTRFFTHDVQVAVLLSLASFVIGAASAKDVLLHRRSILRLAATALDWEAAALLTSL